MSRILKVYWQLAITVVAIAFLSFYSSNKQMELQITIPHIDKVAHFIMYFFMGRVVLRSFYLSRKFLTRYITYSILISFSYGVICELIQYQFIEGREGDVFDALVNLAGAVVGALYYSRYKKERAKFYV